MADITMNKEDLKKIRKKIFNGNYTSDQSLVSICKNHPTHSFLTNTPSQVIYQYLIRFVVEYCEYFFKKDRSQLKVLDWGCGKGHCSYLLKKFGVPAISCDLKSSRNDSAFGQDTPIISEADIKVLPIEHSYIIPFDANQFDAVISMGVLEHVSNDLQSLFEINRILKPNGLFFCFFLPQKLSWTQFLSRKMGDTYHDRLYTKKSVNELLIKSDFLLHDIWHRQLFPKNSVNYPIHNTFERLDHFLNNNTPLKYFSTNLEFVAEKQSA